MWERLRELVESAQAALDRIRALPADQVTPEMHQEVDEIYRRAADVRAEIDRKRSVERLEAVGEQAAMLARQVGPDVAAAMLGGAPAHGMARLSPQDAAAALVGASGEPIPAEVAARWADATGGRVRGDRGGVLIPMVQASTTALMPGTVADRQIAPAVYPTGVLDVLGIGMELVGSGEQHFRWIRPASATMTAEGGAIAVADSQTDQEDLKPLAAVAATTLTIEAGAVDSMAAGAIIDNLMAGVADRIEQQVLSGSGDAPQVAGIFDAAATVGASGATGDASTFADVVGMVGAAVDGRYATMTSDLAMVTSADVHGYLAALYPASTGDRSALEALEAMGVRVAVSAHVAAADSTTKIGQVAIRRGRMTGSHALPVWRQGELFRSALDMRGSDVVARQVLVLAGMFNWKIAPRRADFLRGAVRIETVS